MSTDTDFGTFAALSTPLVCDACLRLRVPARAMTAGVRPVVPGLRLAGRDAPVRHYGSVDVFLEAIELAQRGDVLVIDNGGRMDEGCIGDLSVLETRAGGLAGMVVNGAHRDTVELARIAFPVFTRGIFPFGPRRLDPRAPDALVRADVGGFEVGKEDAAFADDDGVVFAPLARCGEVLALARSIFETERRQAELVVEGRTLREQFAFRDYLAARAKDPALTFRKHLRRLGGEIEE